MSPLVVATVALTSDPSPAPTGNELRPGLEEWQVSPGLIGFIVTFALALACVLLFLNMSRHLRKVGHNARRQGLPVPTPEVIGFRPDGTVGTVSAQAGADGSADAAGSADSGRSADSGGTSPSGTGTSGTTTPGTGQSEGPSSSPPEAPSGGGAASDRGGSGG